MRVPDNLRLQLMTSNMATASERLQRYQIELSSGLRIQRPSDDPSGAQRASSLRSNLARIAQYQATTKDAQAWLKSEDSALGNIVTSLRRIRDYALQAANPNFAGSHDTMVTQIKSQAGFVQQSLNTSDGSRYLFGGNKTLASPFQGNLTGGITYAGDDGVRHITLNDSVTLNLNHSGSEVANLGGASDPALPDMFQTINDLVTAVQACDQAAIATQISNLDQHLGRVTNLRAETGVRLNQVELSADQLSQTKLTLTNLLNDTESADLTEVTVQLKEQENVLQAATYVASTIGRGGLLDWLK
ncbi:MAG: flagellar hook-associated protein FlgL [Armatimonadota bacterium]